MNTAETEEEALNLLFLGDTNRVVAETPMNDVSTRSRTGFASRALQCSLQSGVFSVVSEARRRRP